MKRLIVVCCLLVCFVAGAQRIRTIVPREAVVIGTAFQVQYIITDPTDLTGIIPPVFDSVELVSGPNHYKGNALVDGRQQPIENITYTLVATRLGVQKIGSIRAQFKGLPEQKANDVLITVTAAPKASFHTNSSYTDVNLYAPPASADRQQLVDANLFVRTQVDKKTCYVGEPVTAVFKLYSRLQSTSEVVNAPSLYGFSVVDVLDTHQSYPGVETINGQVFNTSILRMLQLYPGQPGALVIDGMQLQNEIEFDDPQHPGNKTKLEKTISSPSVPLLVKPLPDGRPDDYTGAVGEFSISAALPEVMSTSSTGQLVITIRGAGNFIQFAPPAISWPSGLDALEPAIADTLDKTAIPEKGFRSYTFRFTADSAGLYVFPPVLFSFFNPSAGSYQTVSTDTLRVQVKPSLRTAISKLTSGSTRNYFIWIIIFILLFTIFFLLIQRKKKKAKPSIINTIEEKPSPKDEIKALEKVPAQQAGIELEKILRRADRSGLVPSNQKQELSSILADCQLLAYSSLDAEGKKEELIARALRIVE
jgi:hypothetical protein